MSSLGEIQSVRQKKLAMLAEHFDSVYPARTERTHTIAKVQASFSTLLRGKKTITLAGRVRSLRPHGGSVFFDIEEDGALFQIFLRKEDVDEKAFTLFVDAIDVGDFVEVTGKPYVTKRKERSLIISKWRPLAKSLRPLPDNWSGLKDVEERYRRRALDLLANPEVREAFAVRSRLITAIRTYLDTLGFLEVETPMLQNIPGGTTAKPFQTHHNALDIDLYLRIAPELFLKRLLVGGYSNVYEIGRNFRNEGIDVTHNPEFTMLEAYSAYMDYEGLMKFIEAMMRTVVKAVLKKKPFSYQGTAIDVSKPFKKISFYDSLAQYALLPNAARMSSEEVSMAGKRYGIDVRNALQPSAILEDIFRKAVRPRLIQPTFVTNHPAALLPLAKRSEKQPDTVESFQLYIGGIELVKAFSELNDPADQRVRFEEQEELRKKGDEEAAPADYDFVENLEYGMPPAAGFGIGIDRFAMLLTDTHNLRDVILFPTLRPKS